MKKIILICLLFLALFANIAIASETPVEYSSGDYRYVLMDDGTAKITGYSGNVHELTLPTLLDGNVVSTLDSMALLNSSLQLLKIPNEITSLIDNPFSLCMDLESVYVEPDHPTLAIINGVLFDKVEKSLIGYPRLNEATHYDIPSGIKNIGMRAFASCKYLEYIGVPDTVERIDDFAFSGCSSIKEIHLPDSVISLGTSVFSYCNGLNNLSIPDSLIKIAGNPVPFCQNLKSISVSSNHPTLELVDEVLFDKGEKTLIYYPPLSTAENYIIPEGTRTISDNAFENCDNLKTVTIPYGVTSIGANSFSNCDSLIEILLPDSVTEIGRFCFGNSRLLESVDLPHNPDLVLEHSVFSSCVSLKNIVIPDGTTSIQNNSFGFCKSLQSVIIPHSVTFISDNAFDNCSTTLMLTVVDGSYAERFAQAKGIMYTYPNSNDWLNS